MPQCPFRQTAALLVDQRVMHVNPLRTFAQTHSRPAMDSKLSEKNANEMPCGNPLTPRDRVPERSTVTRRQGVRFDPESVPFREQESDTPSTTSGHIANESMQMHSQVLIGIFISSGACGSLGGREEERRRNSPRMS
jgi:hypothetical protein